MDISTAIMDLGPTEYLAPARVFNTSVSAPHENGKHQGPFERREPRLAMELLRQCAWEIGEQRPADRYGPDASHVGLAMVHPTHGFAHYHMLLGWVEETARARGHNWDGSRPVLRLYDVSYIEFTGLNAHRIQDHTLPGLAGQLFFNLPNPGTWQVAEVGFVLRNGEFIPAARSPVVPFAPDAPSRQGGHAALFVPGPGRSEPIDNVWSSERELRERRRPRLRQPLRFAAFAFASRPSGPDCALATFVTELAAGQAARGHDVHVFVPATEHLPHQRQEAGVTYHPLPVRGDSPIELAQAFSLAARARLREFPPFDLLHLHEWMTGLVPGQAEPRAVLSLSSLEATRRNGAPPDELSRAIEQTERELAKSARHVLTPGWLRDRAVGELGLPPERVHPFAMEGRLPNEWEQPLDVGQVKMGAGFGPLDRMMIYVGPLEHAAGVDLLVEALPVLLRRWGNLRIAFVGLGPMHGHLLHRAGEMGVGHAVRLFGHVSGPWLTQLLRASEALVLPSRYRQPQDDAVVDLARKAARPVITTHGGPAHLVRHEENGLVTYDNPGSMVWALDRALGDPGHADRMGNNGRRSDSASLKWDEVAGHYLEACVSWFPELTVTKT
jgi:glycosyltransferase involved in cell wall biosynthesis